MSEELKGQIGEASPTLPAYFSKAWAEYTKSNLKGAQAQAALMKAMEKGQVKSDIALRALELAALDAQPGLARSTQTSAAQANRARNTRSYTMNESSIAGVEDGFYRLNTAIAVFTSDLAPHAEDAAVAFAQYLGATADFTLGLRGLAKGIPGAKQDTIKAAKELPWKYMAFGNPVVMSAVTANTAHNWYKGKQSPSTPTKDGITRLQQLQEHYAKPLGIFPGMGLPPSQLMGLSSKNAIPLPKYDWHPISRGEDGRVLPPAASMPRTDSIGNSSVVTINNTWEISSTAVDVEGLSRELEPKLKQVFNQQQQALMGGALLQFGQD